MADTTLITREPAVSGIATPGAPSRRTGIRRTLARAATAASCLACGLLALPAIASATVNNTTSQWSQPPGIVYTFQKVNNVGGDNLMEDNANAMSNGSLVDTWPLTNSGIQAQQGNGPSVVQANMEWEFVPETSPVPNTGGSITTGWGQLINRQSGLCLDVNGASTADAATVDQWQCVPGALNEEWGAVYNSARGGYVVQAEFDEAALGSNTMNCIPNPNGTDNQIVARTFPSACTVWNIQRTSYQYATDIVTVPQAWDETDAATYGCLSGYTIRENPVINSDDTAEGGAWDPVYANLSDTGGMVIAKSDNSSDDYPIYQPAYTNDGTSGTKSGQIAAYCDPNSTNP
jgi:hypothetical protein